MAKKIALYSCVPVTRQRDILCKPCPHYAPNAFHSVLLPLYAPDLVVGSKMRKRSTVAVELSVEVVPRMALTQDN